MLCDKLKINIFSVLNAAETKPFGFTRFNPGPGVGGHCIPIDPLFIKWIAKKNNFNTQFITLSNKTNIKVTTWTINKIMKIYKKNFLERKRKILFLGATYKKNVNDIRESPSIQIFNYFFEKKIPFDYYDPFVKKINLKKGLLKSIKSLKELKEYSMTVLLVDHDIFDLKNIYQKSHMIIDTRGKFNKEFDKKIIIL